MSEWQYSSVHWDNRVERITPRVDMLCCRRPTPYDGEGGDRMWVYVRERKEVVKDDYPNYTYLELILIEPSDHLMLECIAHEMRKKYGGAHS